MRVLEESVPVRISGDSSDSSKDFTSTQNWLETRVFKRLNYSPLELNMGRLHADLTRICGPRVTVG